MGIGKNAAIGLITNVIVFGLGILLSVILTRGLGPQQRGVYALLVSSNGLLANMAGLTVGAACSTLLAHGRYRLGEVNTIAVLLALALGAAGAAVTALAFPLLSTTLLPNIPFSDLLVGLVLLPPAIYQNYWSLMLIGLNHVVLLNKVSLVLNVGNTLLMLLTVGLLHLGLPGFLLAWVSSTLAGAVVNLVVIARLDPLRWPPDRALLRAMLSFGLRSHGATVANHLFLRFDWYAVNALVSVTGVGFYSLATSLAEKLWLPLNAVSASSLNRIAHLPREESALLTAKVTRATVLITLALALPLAVVSPWLIPFLYGPAFAASVLPLLILLAGVPGFAVMLVLNNYIQGRMERPGLLSLISWAELGVSVPLYLGLILWQGLVGAALASTLTYLLAMAGTLYVFARDSGLPLHRVLVPRGADFQEYLRLVRAGLRRVPALGRYAAGKP